MENKDEDFKFEKDKCIQKPLNLAMPTWVISGSVIRTLGYKVLPTGNVNLPKKTENDPKSS